MTTYTKLELDILKILAAEHLEYQDDGEFFTEDPDGESPHIDTWILTTDGLEQGNSTIFEINNLDPKVYRGVISSLLNKGAVLIDYYNTQKSIFVDVEMIIIGISRHAFYQTKEILEARKDTQAKGEFL